jgi:hypothetical protein
MPRCPTLVLTVLVTFALSAAVARADTIVVIGAAGSDGTPGGPGAPGGDAGPGADAVAATAVPADALASARADGGSGGDGGAGGAGAAGQDGGDGGAGGAGGSANATANSSPALGPATADLRAFGGLGGDGGAGGLAGAGATAGSPGPGGSGGAAVGNACAVSSNGNATTTFWVAGGSGGTGGTGGAAGSASAEVCAESEGAGSASVGQAWQGGVGGGQGGDSLAGAAGAGGAATGSAEAGSATGSANALMSVRGGFGGEALVLGAGGGGGAANASAVATGGSSASASAEAIGGDGGTGRGTGNAAGDGGGAAAQAEAHASAGFASASARAQGGSGGKAGFNAPSANGGDGASVSLVNAVAGSSPTSLVLEQIAIAGSGGSAFLDGNGGDGGDATSLGTFSNPLGGAISVTLEAQAGSGGSGAIDGSGGNAHIGGSVTAAADRDAGLVATIRAGSSNDGAAGVATIDPLLASTSGSGHALVDLTVLPTGTAVGDGADVSLVNRIDAVTGTAGRITLRQELWGGSARSLGHGGLAEGVLTLARSAAQIDLATTARGGSSSTGLGGDARVDLRASNDAGGVTLDGSAWGGEGGSGHHEGSGDGGDASGRFEAETAGDGHDIRIGWDEAIEVNGGSARAGFSAGDASFLGRGVASGDSRVTVQGFSRGVNATADAFGSNAGAEDVEVFAGASGVSASATARGESVQGDVSATVIQEIWDGGGDSVLENVASGATAGNLELVQFATGGRNLTGNAGDARSAFDVSHLGGGDLELWLEADGGDTATGQAGDGEIEAFGEAIGDVRIQGTARAGSASPGGAAGQAIIAGLFGRSLDGGTVTVRGSAVGAAPGPGAPLVLDNAVDGETTGALVLGQSLSGFGEGSNRLATTASSASLRADISASTTLGAQSELDVTNTAGSVVANAQAIGGEETNVSARATSAGDGHDVTLGGSTNSYGAFGRAASAGLAAGDATSISEGIALGDSKVSVTDLAIGGDSLSIAFPEAGLASSHAEGSNQGASQVNVSAYARGGEGVQGAGATATASGSSQSGSVSVSASQVGGRSIGGDGVDLAVVDAVTGSTAGHLALRQSTSAGNAETGFGVTAVRGGDARSELNATNPGGGSLAATVEAFGGRGSGERGGHAVVLGSAEGAADVSLLGHAVAGESPTPGAEASIESLFARSTGGGEVGVTGRVTSGGSVLLDDVVDGETTGVLRLTQHAEARGGATSLLDREESNEHLALRSIAEAGQVSGDGALADAFSRSRNLVGGADAFSDAQGGSSTGANGGSARGGEALARTSAHALSELRDADAWSEASGGNAGTSTGAGGLDGVAGGSATAEATALAEAVLGVAGSADRGPAEARARATGGRGGVLDEVVDAAGRGGDASATSSATGGDQVFAEASAEGGRSGLLAGIASGAGGDARAIATALGERDVFASASAVGGAGAPGSEGSALARAAASGKGGEVAAIAALSAAAGFPAPVVARADATLKGDVNLGATMATGALLSDDEALGFLDAARHVSDGALADALAGNANVAAALDGAEVLALLATGANATDGKLSFTSELTMSASFLAPSAGDELLIGFLDPDLGGIKKLEVVVSLGDQVVFEGRAKQGKPMLDDVVLTLDLASGQSLAVSFAIKAGKSTETGALDLVIATRGASPLALAAAPAAVPEPRTLALLALAGVALAATRRRPRRADASPRGSPRSPTR